MAFRSLRATAIEIVNAWLGGQISTPFARLALEQTFVLTEQARTELTRSAATAADQRAAALADACARLSRALAALAGSVKDGDRGEVRRLSTDLPDDPS